MTSRNSTDQHSHTAENAEFENNSGCRNENIEGISPPSQPEPRKLGGKRKIIFKCYFCKLVFPNKVPLDYHLEAVHSGQDTLSCSECKLTFEKITIFNAHLGRHDESLRPFKCVHCPMRFLQRINKERHMAALHAKASKAGKDDCTKEQIQEGDAPQDGNHEQETLPGKGKRKDFKCYLCETNFTRQVSLDHHLETTHSDLTEYSCRECSSSFSSIVAFNQHLGRHDAVTRRYKCDYCTLRFTDRYLKYRHVIRLHAEARKEDHARGKVFTDERQYDCPQCTERFTTKNSLKLHRRALQNTPTELKRPSKVKRQQSRIKNLNPDTITSSFPVKTEALGVITTEEVHIVSILPAEIKMLPSSSSAIPRLRKITKLKCYMCAENPSFDVRASLTEHLTTIHSKFDLYECEECNITLHTAVTINYHLSRHDASERPFKCGECPLRFAREPDKLSHEAAVHMTTTISSDENCCPICGRKFSNEHNLHRHMKTTHQKNAPKNAFWCYLCSTVPRFDDNDSLAEHLAATHPEQESYSCTECNITLRGRAIFNWHLSMHDANNDKPFKCSYCPKRFMARSNMKRHELYHNIGRQKTYECVICSLCFVSAKAREKHEANVHGTQESQSSTKIACTICDMKFIDRVSSTEHMRTAHHQEDQLFHCYLCTDATIVESQSLLTEHLLTNHQNQEQHTCKHCGFNSADVFSFNEHLSQHERGTVQSAFAIETTNIVEKKFFRDTVENGQNELPNYGSLLLQAELPTCDAIKTEEVHIYDEHPPQGLNSNDFVVQADILSQDAAPTVANSGSEAIIEMEQNKAGEKLTTAIGRARGTFPRKHKRAILNRNKENFKCYLCNNTSQFEAKASLNIHILKAHLRQETYKCSECNTTTQNVLSFNMHLARHDASIRPVKCSVCSLRFTLQDSLTRHLARAHSIINGNKEPSKSLRCPTCGKKFAFDSKLKLHTRSGKCGQLKLTKSYLRCYLCSEVPQFDTLASLDDHLSAEHSKKGLHSCGECNNTFLTVEDFNQHLSRHDVNVRPFKCTVCPMRFLTYKTKRDHQIWVHNLKSERSTQAESSCCPTCGKEFKYRCELKEHIRVVHGEDLPVEQNLSTCYLCETSTKFHHKAAFDAHLSTVHPTENEYKCEECNVIINNKHVFNQHLSRHDVNLRPHKCSVCSLRFETHSNRKIHESNEHSNQNKTQSVPKYDCTICEEKFMYQSSLSVHVRKVHNIRKMNLRPHKCTICPLRFIEREDRKRHEADVHNVGIEKHNYERSSRPVFKCYLCTDVVIPGSRRLLVLHLAAAHPALDQYTCQHCDFSSAEIFAFNEHLSQHVVETTSPNIPEMNIHEQKIVQTAVSIETRMIFAKNFACKDCGKRFAFECSKIRHEQCMHSKRPSAINLKKHFIKCHLCKTTVGSKQFLTQHLDTAHPSQPLYQCKKCTFCTIEKYDYNNHQMRHDRSVRRYKCRFCSLRYMTAQSRKCHVQFEHANGYACTGCDGKFSFKWQVRLHEKTSSHTVHKIVTKVETKSQESNPLNDEQIYQQAIKTEEVHIYSELFAEEIDSPHEAFHDTQQSIDDFEPKLRDAGIQSTCLEKESAERPQRKRRICPNCGKNVLHDRYDQHMKTEHDVEKPACSTSAMEFDSGDILRQHKLYTHNKEGPISTECHLYNDDTLLKSKENMSQHLVPHRSVQFPNPGAIISGLSNNADLQMQISTKMHSISTLDIPDPDVLAEDVADQSHNAVKLEKVLVFSEHTDVSIDSFSLRAGDVPGIFNADQNVLYSTHAVNTDQQLHSVPSTSGTFNTIGCNSNVIQEEIVYLIKSEPETQHYSEQLETNFGSHYLVTSDTTKAYLCHLCNPGSQMENKSALDQHLASHPAQDMYYCGKCDFSVNLITMFNQHLAQHYVEDLFNRDDSEDAKPDEESNDRH